MKKQFDFKSIRSLLILLGVIGLVALLDTIGVTPGLTLVTAASAIFLTLSQSITAILREQYSISNFERDQKDLRFPPALYVFGGLSIIFLGLLLDERSPLPFNVDRLGIPAGVALVLITLSPITLLAARLIKLGRNQDTRLQRAVKRIEKEIKPKFAFYFSGSDLATPMHFTVWEKYLNAFDVPYMIVLRERKHLAYFDSIKYENIPVVFTDVGRTIGKSIPASVTTVFYANNGFKNLELINARPELRHVQLLHGDSDKPSSYSPVVRCYTDLFVSGQMAIDRYTTNSVQLQGGLATIVGRPQTEDIQVVENIGDKDELTIAYMPTWLGYHEEARFSSLAQAPQIIRDILNHDFGKKVHILFKAHPMSYKDPNAATYFDQIKIAIANSRKNTAEIVDINIDAITLFNKSDALIADISSVVIDFLYSKKPYLITNPNNFDLNDLKRYPCTEGGYLLTPEADNVIGSLEEALGNDRLKTFRTTKLREYAFGDTHMKPGQLFKEEALAIIHRLD